MGIPVNEFQERFGILTVCTGNICRSPLARAFLEQEFSGLPFDVDSAGVRTENGLGPPPETLKVAEKYGISLERHASKQVQISQLRNSGLILSLDRTHRKALIELAPFSSRRLFTLSEFAFVAKSVGTPGQLSDSQSACEKIQKFVEHCSRMRGLVLSEVRPKDILDIEDPFGKSFQYFEKTGAEIAEACKTIGSTLRTIVGRQ